LQKQIERLTQREQELATALGQVKVRQAAPTSWYTLAQLRSHCRRRPSISTWFDSSLPTGQARQSIWPGLCRLKTRERCNSSTSARRWISTKPSLRATRTAEAAEDGAEKEKVAAEKKLQEALMQLSDRLLKPIWSR